MAKKSSKRSAGGSKRSRAHEETEDVGLFGRPLVRDALTLLIFAISVYLFLSLSAGRSLTGPIGGVARDVLTYLFGLPGSFLLVCMLFALGVINLLERSITVNRSVAFGVAGSVLMLATLVAIPEIDTKTPVMTDDAVRLGGIFGGGIARFLVAFFHTFGATLIALTLCTVALIFATDRALLPLIKRGLSSLARFVTAPAPQMRPLEADGEYEEEDADEEEWEYVEVDDDEEAGDDDEWEYEYEDEEEEEEEEEEDEAPPPKPSRKARSVTPPKAAAAKNGSKKRGKKAAEPEPTPEPDPEPEVEEEAPLPKPVPEPVIRGQHRSDEGGPAPDKNAPIEPPDLGHFAGLPQDSTYEFPSWDLLDEPKPVDELKEAASVRRCAERLVTALSDFKVEAEVVEIQKGPVVAMYELSLAPGTKVRQITNLSDDIARAIKAPNVRVVSTIPGKSTIGIEVPNQYRETVSVKALVRDPAFRKTTAAIPLLLGKDGNGAPLIEDLAQMPHLLVAGATGAGKSVCLNTIILSVLLTRRPEETQLILIDPKMVELSQFRKIPHLMTPVVTDMRRAPGILDWAVQKMEDRYALLHDAGVRHLTAYNRLSAEERAERLEENARDPETAPPYLPYIVIIVDELADMMMTAAKEVEASITRLAQKSRAVGIHIVLATQRPSADVLTGLIKANMPTRISFRVSSKTDSRIIVDQNGAERLLGMGDMLYLPPRSSILRRCQGTYVSDEEIRRIVRHATKASAPQFDEELTGVTPFTEQAKKKKINDALYEQAVETVLETGRGSTSLLQRKFQIGYTRAARLVDIMAEQGIVGKYKGSQAREVIISSEDWEKMKADS